MRSAMILRRCPYCKILKDEGVFKFIRDEGFICYTCYKTGKGNNPIENNKENKNG